MTTRVLIIDDSPTMRAILTARLSKDRTSPWSARPQMPPKGAS